jgi:hypothetical protein
MHSHKERFEHRFLKWIEYEEKPLSDLLLISKLDSNNQLIIEEIGLKTLINVVCTSGANESSIKAYFHSFENALRKNKGISIVLLISF